MASIKCTQCERQQELKYDDYFTRAVVEDHLEMICGTSRFFVVPATPGEGIFASACCGAVLTYEIEGNQ